MRKRYGKMMEVLRYLNDLGDELVAVDRKSVYRKLYGGYPSTGERVIKGLEKKGWVKNMKVTDEGRKQVMLHLLKEIGNNKRKWDGKWRVIFFDISSRESKKRDKLRAVLKGWGCHEIQKSVYVTPFECKKEIEYIREALGLGEGIRVGILEEIDNEEELRSYFRLG